MEPHLFLHGSEAYAVFFGHTEGEWFAMIYRERDREQRYLAPTLFDPTWSEPAIRAGFIGVAEWLVKTERWPSAPASIPTRTGSTPAKKARCGEPKFWTP